MSAGESEQVTVDAEVDSVCPHGEDFEPPAPLDYVRDPEEGTAVLFDPEDITGERWLQADESAFIDGRAVR
ncbi:hypothetical protein HWV23_02625 [Natronomonas halophila]|uniref:hypothetical protein n=1 Tax=Natronomonas halophila TaxID=2747817 RepID=UPI0015B786DC|nr:hypothetical protein [Natronomonas halophila]QLD84595.1 hypothetical protein HWV23_02340 [Natronomonas halophila]QLD84651.1 hypothetical protein HWV23_02625 [Natronomonas halophila]